MSVGLVLAGRYRLTKQLGQGGMGSVWRAEDLTLGAEVAVKLIDASLAESSEALARFRREAQAAASIRSTYVVQILDHGIDQGTPYIAMELLNGESLAARLERVIVLSPEQTARLLGHTGRALSLAHEHGIVHRDMKPENIFLVREDDEDVGKVLDFGIARKSGGLSEVGGLKTSTGAILGTPYYMSPEQATGQAIDHRTDIWSYGAIAFECLIGRRAFEGESLGALFHAICMADLPIPSQCGNAPPGFDVWFARAVNRDKEKRYQTIKEASDDLRVVCSRASGLASSVSLSGSRGTTIASTTGAVPARTGKAGTFGHTAPPSALTMAGTAKKPASSLMLVLLVLPAVGILLGGSYASWRWLRGSQTAAAASSAVVAPPAPPRVEPAPPSNTAVRAVVPSPTVAPDVIPVEPAKSVALESPPVDKRTGKHGAATPTNVKTPPRAPTPREPAHVPEAQPKPEPPREPAPKKPPVVAPVHDTNASGI
jgi:eukaryotic-like serine/threonine-protein kinase